MSADKLVISLGKLRGGRLLTMKGCGCAIGQIIDQLTPRGHKLWVRRKLGKSGHLMMDHIKSLRYFVPELGERLAAAGIIREESPGLWVTTAKVSNIYAQSDYVAGDLAISGHTDTKRLARVLNWLDLEVEIVE